MGQCKAFVIRTRGGKEQVRHLLPRLVSKHRQQQQTQCLGTMTYKKIQEGMGKFLFGSWGKELSFPA